MTMELPDLSLATRDSLQHSKRTLSQILDALLFASQKALSLKELKSYLKAAALALPEGPAAAFANVKEMELLIALQALRDDIAATHRSYELRETASGWQLVTASAFAPWLRQLFPEAKPTRLSAPALETLAIIAYRQPITRADIEAVRGVAVDGVMQTILDRGLIRIEGRAEVPGRPLLYATTQSFLDHFGLRHLNELPNAAELRYIPLPKAEVREEASATVKGLSGTGVAVEKLKGVEKI
ncbi:MAG: SMC-Scp complex subunit ScpB [Chthoniobacterales bacterium]